MLDSRSLIRRKASQPPKGLTPAPAGYPIKLVRDRTPEILNGTGEPGALFYGPATGDRSRLLRLKLAEEVGEYLVDGGFGELRDVLAVVEALAAEHGSTLATLVQALRADPRGGFAEGVMMYGHHPEFDDQEAPDAA
jgi:predicted house-cleaning noncanonical NTP pyrophosphatase (MazG superfamily)